MKTLFKLLPTTCLLLIAPAMMMGNVYTYTTPNGSTQGGQAVNASAVFTTGSGTLSIVLSDLLSASQMLSAGQLLSDLRFTMNNAANSGTVTSESANLLQVADNGSSSSAGSTNALGWTLTNTGAGAFYLDGLNGAANTPAHLIIGGAAGDSYSNANDSIAKTGGPHNPFAATSATFSLNIAGVTSSTLITSAIFSFGTASGNETPGVLNPVPEPSTYSFLVLGVAMLGFVAYRKKKFASA